MVGWMTCQYCHEKYQSHTSEREYTCPFCFAEWQLKGKLRCKVCEEYYDPALSPKRNCCPACLEAEAIPVPLELVPTQNMSYTERWRRVAVHLSRLEGQRLTAAEIERVADGYSKLPRDQQAALLQQAKATGWVGEEKTVHYLLIWG